MQHQSIYKNNASTLDGQSSSPNRCPWVTSLGDAGPLTPSTVTLFHSRNNCSDPNRFYILLRCFQMSMETVVQSRSILSYHNATPLAPGIPLQTSFPPGRRGRSRCSFLPSRQARTKQMLLLCRQDEASRMKLL